LIPHYADIADNPDRTTWTDQQKNRAVAADQYIEDKVRVASASGMTFTTPMPWIGPDGKPGIYRFPTRGGPPVEVPGFSKPTAPINWKSYEGTLPNPYTIETDPMKAGMYSRSPSKGILADRAIAGVESGTVPLDELKKVVNSGAMDPYPGDQYKEAKLREKAVIVQYIKRKDAAAGLTPPPLPDGGGIRQFVQ
jgi:hypothetical protein